jgi:hypothetical protein
MIHSLEKKSIKWWVGCIACIVLFGAIALFAYMKMSFVLRGVKLQANVERNGNSPVVHVKGNAYGATYVTLNGREIYIEKDGSFTEDVVLLPGLSVLKLDTEDKFGNTALKKFELVYKDGGQSVAIGNKIINNN